MPQVQMNKKIPERKCIGCNARRPKNELVRIVRTQDGSVTVDKTGKLSGRGAYICPDSSCFKKAVKAKRFESNLEISIPENIYSEISELLDAQKTEKEESAK